MLGWIPCWVASYVGFNLPELNSVLVWIPCLVEKHIELNLPGLNFMLGWIPCGLNIIVDWIEFYNGSNPVLVEYILLDWILCGLNTIGWIPCGLNPTGLTYMVETCVSWILLCWTPWAESLLGWIPCIPIQLLYLSFPSWSEHWIFTSHKVLFVIHWPPKCCLEAFLYINNTISTIILYTNCP